MQRILDVAWREFRHTVMTKAFLLAAVVLPAVMWSMAIVLPLLLHAPPKALVGELAVIDADKGVFHAAVEEFDGVRLDRERDEKLGEIEAAMKLALPEAYRSTLQKQLDRLREATTPKVELVLVDESALDEWKARVRAGQALAVARFESSVLRADRATNKFDLFLGENLTRQHTETLRDALRRAVVRARASAANLDLAYVRQLVSEPSVVTTTVTKTGGEAAQNEIARLLTPLAFMMLLWTATMLTGQYLLTSTIEEKSNRVMEVLLSAVSPMELLSGKILGQCCVGLLVIGLYGGVGVTTASNLGYAHLVPFDKLVYLVLYFLMAFFMLASVMAAVGAAVNELREAQTLMGPVTLLFMVPFFAWFFISENPNSTFSVVLSFVPPLTPFTMMLRLTAAESVPFWQVPATAVVGFAGVYAAVWAAARIFRVGLLMTGKAPTPRELWKWLRQT
jgi:ABC-2 type transport system permease protein